MKWVLCALAFLSSCWLMLGWQFQWISWLFVLTALGLLENIFFLFYFWQNWPVCFPSAPSLCAKLGHLDPTDTNINILIHLWVRQWIAIFHKMLEHSLTLQTLRLLNVISSLYLTLLKTFCIFTHWIDYILLTPMKLLRGKPAQT